jgi:hypothetical protein
MTRRPLTFRRFAATTVAHAVRCAALIAVLFLGVAGFRGLTLLPADAGPPLSERDQHRAVAVKSHAVSHGCRTTEPYPPHDEQRSALVEDAPGEIRLTSIDEGRAVLSGDLPGVLLAVCER